MGKKYNRFVSISMLIALLALVRIKGNYYEKDINYDQVSSLNNYDNVDEIYTRLNMDKDIINSSSVKKIGIMVEDFMGNDNFYTKNFYNHDDVNCIELTNANLDEVRFYYLKELDVLSVECQRDNIRYHLISTDNNNISVNYIADDKDNNFYSIDYTNSFEKSRSIYYKEDNRAFSISLNNDYNGYNLYIFDGKDNSERILLSSEEYISLLSTMSKYNNGLDLDKFLLEDNFAKYIEKIAIINPNLYLELLKHDDGKKLKLNIV